MGNIMIGSCSTAGRNLKTKKSSAAAKTLATTCKTKKATAKAKPAAKTTVKKVSKPKATPEVATSGRFAGRPAINYKVTWSDKKDPKFKGIEFHKTLEQAKEDAKGWKELGYNAKIEKGNYTNIYWGNPKYQI
jgi:hypothetical protein